MVLKNFLFLNNLNNIIEQNVSKVSPTISLSSNIFLVFCVFNSSKYNDLSYFKFMFRKINNICISNVYNKNITYILFFFIKNFYAVEFSNISEFQLLHFENCSYIYERILNLIYLFSFQFFFLLTIKTLTDLIFFLTNNNITGNFLMPIGFKYGSQLFFNNNYFRNLIKILEIKGKKKLNLIFNYKYLYNYILFKNIYFFSSIRYKLLKIIWLRCNKF